MRVLISSAGRRVELLNCFRSGAAALGVPIEVFACDRSPGLSAACQSADAAFAVPSASDSGYAAAVLEICRQHGIELVIPTIDPELLPLSLARDEFLAHGCDIAVSSPELIGIARDKLLTAQFLSEHGIPSPRTLAGEAVATAPADWCWPAFAKPRHGSAGRAVRPIACAAELAGFDEPMIVQQLLRGAEYTINMFFDRAGELRCAIPHERLQVRAGEVEKGITRRTAALSGLARDIAVVLPQPRGALCFQAMIGADGQPSVFEINARFGGGYPLADRAGATFARWLIEEALGLTSSANDDWQAGLTMLRYDAAVFGAF